MFILPNIHEAWAPTAGKWSSSLWFLELAAPDEAGYKKYHIVAWQPQSGYVTESLIP